MDLVALGLQIRLGSSVTLDIWIEWRAVYQKALHFLLIREHFRVAERLARPAASRTRGEIRAPNRICILPRSSAGIADELLGAHAASADLVGQERAVWPSALQIEHTRTLPVLSGAPPSRFSSSAST